MLKYRDPQRYIFVPIRSEAEHHLVLVLIEIKPLEPCICNDVQVYFSSSSTNSSYWVRMFVWVIYKHLDVLLYFQNNKSLKIAILFIHRVPKHEKKGNSRYTGS